MNDRALEHGPNGEIKNSLVVGQTGLGTEIQAPLLRLTRYVAAFEIYTPTAALRASEVFRELQIVLNGHTIYLGRAVIRSLSDAGARLVCEVSLDESFWQDLELSPESLRTNKLLDEFKSFLLEWQKLYRVLPEFKVVVADMQTYLSDLRLWLDQVEIKIRGASPAGSPDLEREAIDILARPVIGSIDTFIDQFEAIAGRLDIDLHPVHREYLRRQLHPLLLGSPFAQRTFIKPLGYAGDYEMVDMMLRPPYEGATLFSKIINVWLLGQAPSTAHHNRVVYLNQRLVAEAMRVGREGKRLRVFNLGCGPAVEVQQFLMDSDFARHAQLTLVDFNEETLQHLKQKLDHIRKIRNRGASVQLIKRSVQQLLKESLRPVTHSADEQYDLVYCAGLFDYLTQTVCKRLMNVLYGLVAPGGLLLATNVSDVMNATRPFRYSMEFILDWHLIYRDRNGLAALTPDQATPDGVNIIAESTGVNVFIEVRKPRP